ncbi:MAG TPA: SDR family NAD(P)-dependent oxidoreductase [Polyangiaceae bacterium]
MQNILITGANRGIGLALTRRFLELGQRVFAGVRNPDNQSAFADLPGDVRTRLGVVGLDTRCAPSVSQLASAAANVAGACTTR